VDAFSLFYKDNKDRLFGYLLRRTGQVQLALDLVQESFVRYLKRYGHRDPHKALLYAIARNAAVDSLRKQRMTDIDGDSVTDPGDNPEQQLIQRQSVERMLAALSQLEPADRELISLVVSSDLTYREIGRILKISETNVKVRVHRVRNKLRQIMVS
jgi:RNA polymerase sigma-70 factor (ECF subfamily)